MLSLWEPATVSAAAHVAVEGVDEASALLLTGADGSSAAIGGHSPTRGGVLGVP
ncbi:hypothetical protein KXS11_05755 [Plantibacter flavus]|uniref:hypothetical protein n=1 Tax=Plantibacter flavus TaxID=150123 RepID=UPI003F13DE6F